MGSIPQLTNNTCSLIVSLTGRNTQAGSAVLGFLMALLFSLDFLFFAASAREALFLRSIVRTGLQFVRLTLETVEVKDFLSEWGHGYFTYGLLPTDTRMRVLAFGAANGPLTIKPSFRRASIKALAASRSMFWAKGPTSTKTPCKNGGSRFVVTSSRGSCGPQPAYLRTSRTWFQSRRASSSPWYTTSVDWGAKGRRLSPMRFCCSGERFRGVLRRSSSSFNLAVSLCASAKDCSWVRLSRWDCSLFSSDQLRANRRAAIPVTTLTNSNAVPTTASQNVMPSQNSDDDWRDILLLVQVAGLFYGFVFMAVRAFRYRGSHR